MQERLIQINHYINNYETNKDSTVLNYYHIFELEESNNLNYIVAVIKKKKLKTLFHPDLLAYIPEQSKKSFEVLSNAVKDMENVFSNIQNKMIYDEKLKKSSKRFEQKTYQFKSTSDLEKLNSIASINIQKYGFKFTLEALEMIIKFEDFRGITNTKSNRTKADILGKKKIETVLNFFTPPNSKKTNLNAKIISYYSFLVYQNNELKEKMDAYINACLATATKYNLDQLSFAINDTLNKINNETDVKNYYSGFTKTDLARENLKKLVNPNDIILLSRMYLNIKKRYIYQNDEISTMNDQQIINEFINTLGEELEKEKNYHQQR